MNTSFDFSFELHRFCLTVNSHSIMNYLNFIRGPSLIKFELSENYLRILQHNLKILLKALCVCVFVFFPNLTQNIGRFLINVHNYFN